MTPDAIRSALAGHLANNLPSGLTAADVAWPNRAFTPPAGLWARFTCLPGVAEEREKGAAGVGLRAGVLIIGLFAPLGSGTSAVLGIAAAIESLYRRASVGGVMCGEPYTEEPGDDGQGRYLVKTTIPFQAWTGE